MKPNASPGVAKSVPLLTTKLHIPPVRKELVPRPRLMAQLNSGLWQNGAEGNGKSHNGLKLSLSFARKLTLVSAPAGFGKTTLLSEWVHDGDYQHSHSRPDKAYSSQDQVRPPIIRSRTAWLSLDDADNDPARFWAYFVAALQTIEPHVGEAVQSALLATHSPPGESLVTAIINDIAAISDHVLMVLDDYHLIEQQRIHNALQFLVEHLPANMHLVIATRSDPPLHLARLRGRGQMNELRQAGLRFTTDEVGAFLNQSMGLGVPVDDVTALASRTEGWIAGLQLAALAISGKSTLDGLLQAESTPPEGPDTTSAFVEAFNGSNRYILDYLVEEVLDQRPEGTRDFLLKTSILDRLSGPLCDAVVGRGNSQEVLEQLERANLFIIPLDSERRWYRYHHLFSDLLRQRLGQAYTDLEAVLHRRASGWYERHSMFAEAIKSALSAGEYERAANLIERAAEAALMRGEIATFIGWMEALPDDIARAYPILCTYHALALVVAARPFNQFESRLQSVVEHDASVSYSGEVALLRAVRATVIGDPVQGIAHARVALERLPERSLFFRGFAARTLGAVHRLAGDVNAALRTFKEAVEIAQKADDRLGEVAALNLLADMRVVQGRLHEAHALYLRTLTLASDGAGRPLPVAIKVLAGQGYVLCEWNDLEAAADCLLQGITLSEKWAEVWGLSGYLHLARVRQAQGDVEGARKAIQTAERLALKYDATETDDIAVAAFQARLWVAQGNLAAAERWVKERGFDDGGRAVEFDAAGFYLCEIEYITLAKVFIAQGRHAQALSVLRPLLEAAERLGRIAIVIEILVLEALAFQGLGHGSKALDSLERALSLAQPERFVRVFLDQGELMADLLRRAAARGIAPRYVSHLLAASVQSEHESAKPSPSSASGQPLEEALTDRERQVLRLLNTHLSSTEIADELFVAPSTVRSHIKNIYSKLNVHRRWNAVQRGKELEMI